MPLLVLTMTAFTTSPFLTAPPGVAVLTLAMMTSPMLPLFLNEPPRTLMHMSSFAPELSAALSLVCAGNCTNIRATAKELGVGERDFCRFLMEEGFLYRCPAGYLLPYAKPSKKGLFQVKDFWKYGHFRQQTLITPQGKDLLRMMLCGGQMCMEFDFCESEA